MSIVLDNRSCFPAEYKQFNYVAGDMLGHKEADLWGLAKILKVDRVNLTAGQVINIQGEDFKVPEDDYLLVVSMVFSQLIYADLAQLKQAICDNTWVIEIGHLPRRTPGIEEGTIYLGNQEVTKEEMEGYQIWKMAFDSGEAGIF